jgi:hypothetical protein
MPPESALLDSLIHGPLWTDCRDWPLTFCARFCDVRARFLSKGQSARSHRAIARNGRVLLVSDTELSRLARAVVLVRLQTWHKAILPGDRPVPYGLLMCVRAKSDANTEPVYAARLVGVGEEDFDLALDVGGGLRLEFRREAG